MEQEKALVSAKVVGNIAILRIDSNERNTLTFATCEQLHEQFMAAEKNSAVSFIAITGDPKAVFSTGADVGEIGHLAHTNDPGELRTALVRLHEIANTIDRSQKTVIAVINGNYCLGGGLELALACDFRIATARAMLGLPEIDLGILPGLGGTQRLPRLIRFADAVKILFGGRALTSAQTALTMGLVDAIIEGDLGKGLKKFVADISAEGGQRKPNRSAFELDEACLSDAQLGAYVAGKSVSAVETIKCVLRESAPLMLDAGLGVEREAFYEQLFSADGKEGVRAFLEKRAARFTSTCEIATDFGSRNGKVPGCAFLIANTPPEQMFVPEDATEEQQFIAKTAREFCVHEVIPRMQKMQHKDFSVVCGLLRESAQIGLLGADIPEIWGGIALDKVSSALIIEELGRSADFLVAFAAHIGICTLPVCLFGNNAQKQRYLPRLTSAELIGAYALTEEQAGSDAAGLRTSATLSSDGAWYLLNGEKIWISNAGFADLFTVFAKVGDKITAFLVERTTPGFTVGAEEGKIGLHGSSTCPLVFADAPVPVENRLGEVGDGFKIALNILNLGRFKLAVGCVGGAKALLAATAADAKDRKAFGKPVAEFGLIQGDKFGAMLTQAWLCESMVYRTAGLLDKNLEGVDANDSKAVMAAIAAYAAECSFVKVYASEMLDFVIDECVQIRGGMGFAEESPQGRAYCDARVNRIFEGTNEINRLFAAGRLIRADLKGGLPLVAAGQKYFANLSDNKAGEKPVSPESLVIDLKKLAVLLLAKSIERFGISLEQEQEVLARVCNAAMRAYALESGVIRAKKLAACGKPTDVEDAIVRLAASEACDAAVREAREVIARISCASDKNTWNSFIRRLAERDADDCIGLRRAVAQRYLDGSWRFRL